MCTRQLLGKTRSELREEDLKTDIYGAEVLFDEQDMPYFHCLVNKSKNKYRDVYPEEVFGVILEEMKRQIVNRIENWTSSCCFTIPFNTSLRTRQLMCSEASKIGLNCVCMIAEPLAAYYSLQSECISLHDGDLIMVVDVETYSFDVSVILHDDRNPQIVCHNSLHEQIIDEVIDEMMKYVMKYYQEKTGLSYLDSRDARKCIRNRNNLRHLCIEALESLSRYSDKPVEISLYDNHRNLYDGMEDVVVSIHSSLFNHDIVLPIHSKLDDFWKKTIRNANINPDQIKHVILTGGSAEIPCILDLFYNHNILTFCCKDKSVIPAIETTMGVLHYLQSFPTI